MTHPLDDDQVATLPLGVARAELLEEIMQTPVTDRPLPAAPARRPWTVPLAAAAAVAVIVGGGIAVAQQLGSPSSTPVASGGPASSPPTLSGRTVENTGQATAGSLVAAIGGVASGEYSRIRGDRSTHESFAELVFTPHGDQVGGTVQVNMQPLDAAGEPDTWSQCPSYTTDCTIKQLPGGAFVRRYRDAVSSSSPGFERNVAELIAPGREIRLVISATNSSPDEIPQRATAVLDIDQLTAMVSESWWDWRLPAEYDGSDLDGYHEMQTSVD